MNIETMTWPRWLPRVLWMHRRCPFCKCGQFKAAELRPYDGLLALFFLCPVRCKFCWRRCYWISLQGAK